MIQLFRVFIPTSILGLLVSETILVGGIYLLAASWLVESGLALFLTAENGWVRTGIVVASVIGGLHFNDFYAHIRVHSRLLLIQQVCMTIGITFLIQALISYSNLTIRMPRWTMVAGSLGCMIVLPAWRIVYGIFIPLIFGAERLLLVGSSPCLGQVASYLLDHSELGILPVGVVIEEGRSAPQSIANDHNQNLPVLGHTAELAEIVRRESISRIALGVEEGKTINAAVLLDARRKKIHVEDIATLYEMVMSRLCLGRLNPADTIIANHFSPGSRNLYLHTVVSYSIALVVLTVTAPLMLVVAIAVAVSSSGPVLFRQTRVGLNNSTFTLYKFRSMYEDAEARTGAVWAKENDPRVTRVGRSLRALRLDELPQLFNVLRGEMAIVGPRPERPEFVKPLAEQIPFYLHRHSVKPGITGWAQVNYKYGNTIEDTAIKLEYDLYYIKNLSLSLDLLTMFHTVKIMLLTRGAN